MYYNCRDVLIIFPAHLLVITDAFCIVHQFAVGNLTNFIAFAVLRCTQPRLAIEQGHQLLWHDKHQASAEEEEEGDNDGSVQYCSVLLLLPPMTNCADSFRKLHNRRNRRSLIYCALLQWF